ncbi:hypothetical protein D9M70_464850 [compost metagenome]
MLPETHHAVVRVAHNNHIATGMPVAPLPCPQIQHVVKIDIRQKRRYHRALGGTLRRGHPTAVLYHTRLKPFADKSEHAPVCNPVSQKHQHPLVIDLIKERRDVRIQYPVHLLALERDRQRIQRIVLATPRPKPIRESQEVFFIDRIQNGNDCLLYDLVLQRGNTQRTLPAVGFGDIDPP